MTIERWTIFDKKFFGWKFLYTEGRSDFWFFEVITLIIEFDKVKMFFLGYIAYYLNLSCWLGWLAKKERKSILIYRYSTIYHSAIHLRVSFHQKILLFPLKHTLFWQNFIQYSKHSDKKSFFLLSSLL